MKMKKFFCVITVLVLALGIITGCSQGNSNNRSNTAGTGSGTTNETEPAATKGAVTESTATENSGSDTSVSDTATDASLETTGAGTAETSTGNTDVTSDGVQGKTLVVYYSASGSTRRVAEVMADTIGADIFEITPVEPYSSEDLNWTNSDSRVSREHDDASLRDVELAQIVPENWESYDTVLIGYPIWWAIAAWPVDNFVKGNDFTGKTVIPFCTSASSGLGESGRLLADMAGTGEWLEGHRFTSGASDKDVQKWVASLNLGE